MLSSNLSSSQEGFKRNPYIYTKNRFSVELTNGINRSNFISQMGTKIPRASIGLTHQLDFEYTFSLGDNFGASLGAGFGFFPFMYRIDPSGDFEGTSGWRYLQLVDYNLIGNLKAGLNYQHWIGGGRYAIKASAGGGMIKTSELGVTILGSSLAGFEYQFKFDYDGKPKPFFYLKSGVDRVLKNDDLLGLSLGYRFISKPIYEGNYLLENFTSSGLMENKKHLYELSLSYTFTRARKMKKAEEFVYEEDLSFKDAKKKFRKEKRYIDPKSIFFGASSGLFFARNQVKRDVAYLKSQSIPSWIVQGDMEMGLDRNLFMQFGFSVAEYWDVIRVNLPYTYGWSGSNAFISPTVSAGLGIRLIGKNNINYLNASAGVALGFNFTQKGQSGSGVQNLTNVQTGESYHLEHLDYDVGHFIPTLYLDLSRDFQLSRAVYFSLDYRINLGFINVYEQHVSFYEGSDITIPQETVVGIKGTSNAFQIGIKYKFVPKSK